MTRWQAFKWEYHFYRANGYSRSLSAVRALQYAFAPLPF